jgi:plasmid stabilization system protein ParE
VRLIFRPEAEADLLRAFNWYEEQRPGLGREFMEEVSRCQEAIEQRPLSFAVVHDTARRAMTHRFPYALIFVVGPDVVSVVAAFHMAGNPESLSLRLASVAEQPIAASRDK